MSGSPLYVPRFRALDANGDPLAGGLVYTYVAGTSTPQDTYTDHSLNVANDNPVVLDADGEADIWLDPSLSYKVELQDSANVPQWSVDYVVAAPGVATGSTTYVTTAQLVNPNILWNGAALVSQAGTSFTGAATGRAMDGWSFAISGGTAANFTFSRQTSGGPTGIPTYIRVQRSNGSTSASTVYLVFDVPVSLTALLGQYLSLSFYARSGSGVLVSGSAGSASVRTGTSAVGTAYRTGPGFTAEAQVAGSTFAITGADWVRYTVTPTAIVPTSSTALAVVFSWATTGTAGTTDYVDITGVKLEQGSLVTPYQSEDYHEVLLKCRKWYYQSFPVGTAPAQNAGTTGVFAFSVGDAGKDYTVTLPAPANLIGTPAGTAATVTTYNPSAANIHPRIGGADGAATAATASAGSSLYYIAGTGAGGNVWQKALIHYTIEARF